jgi:hypothetical protein
LIAAVGLIASGSFLSQLAIVAAVTFILLNRQGRVNAFQATVTVCIKRESIAGSLQNLVKISHRTRDCSIKRESIAACKISSSVEVVMVSWS